MENFEEVAIDLLSEGYNPVPLSENRTPILKAEDHPYLYEKFEDLTWFTKCKKIGVVLGSVSDGLYNIDFDSHNSEPISEKFDIFLNDDLVKDLLANNQLSVYHTPSGGYHVYYRCNVKLAKCSLAKWATKAAMIDFLGVGSYAVIYPSPGYIHLKGAELLSLQYCEESDSTYLMNLCRTFTEAYIDEDKEESDFTTKRFRIPTFYSPQTYKGKYNAEMGDHMKKVLIREGWNMFQVRSDSVEYWTRPDKDQGISATFIPKIGLFFCFTSSDNYLKEGYAYLPFDILREIEFKGDESLANTFVRSLFIDADEIDEIPGFLPFPTDVFPEELSYIIDQFRDKLNFRPDFTAAAMMFAISIIVGNKYKYKVKNTWHAPLVLWIAGVGVSGSNKSHPFNTILKPLINLDASSYKAYRKEKDEYNALSVEDKKKVNCPGFYQHIIKDSTIEAVHQVHSLNQRGVGYHKDELIGFIKEFNRYKTSGGDAEFWLESFNNTNYSVNRVSKEPLQLDNVHISIGGTIQPDRLFGISKELFENGFMYRFLFTSPDMKVHEMNDEDISFEVMNYWEEFINILHMACNYAQESDTILVIPSFEAKKEFFKIDKFYTGMQNSDDTEDYNKQYISKLKTYIPRFALMLAVMDAFVKTKAVKVEKVHMENAFRLSEYFRRTATVFFAEMFKQQEIENVHSVIKRGATVQDQILKLYEAGISQADIAKKIGKSQGRVSQLLAKAKKEKK